MSSFLRPLVISGPSGVGKSTLLKRLFAEYPDKFGFSVSHTTRFPRPGETDGKDYHFVTRDRFLQLLKDGAFIEHAEFSGNFYGTSFMTVKEVQDAGRRCILDIEAQGVRQIKKTSLDPVYLFIAPPSFASLRSRLTTRGTESAESVNKRLKTALDEFEYAKSGAHDVVLVNGDGEEELERVYEEFRKVALGEQEGIRGDALPEFEALDT